jgi:hypothetical protein
VNEREQVLLDHLDFDAAIKINSALKDFVEKSVNEIKQARTAKPKQ